MASFMSHMITGAALTKLGISTLSVRMKKKLYIVAMISAALPDLDVIAFNFGIPYSHWLGHRGLTHSLVFACLWGFIVTWILFRRQFLTWIEYVKTAALLAMVTASHGVIDAYDQRWTWYWFPDPIFE